MAASSMNASLIAILPTPGYIVSALHTKQAGRTTYPAIPARLTAPSNALVHDIVGHKKVSLQLMIH